MADVVGVVMITERRGQDAVDSEVRVRTLEDLFEACRDAPPSRIVKVCLKSKAGEVWLNFATFLRKP